MSIAKAMSFIFSIILYFKLSKSDYGTIQYFLSIGALFFTPFIDSLADLKIISGHINLVKYSIHKRIISFLISIIFIFTCYFLKQNLFIPSCLAIYFFALVNRAINIAYLRKKCFFEGEKRVMYLEKSLPLLLLGAIYFSHGSVSINLAIICLSLSSVASVILSFKEKEKAQKINRVETIEKNQNSELKQIFYSLLAGYFMAAYFKVDQVMIVHILSEVELANYALSLKVLDAIFIIPGLIMAYYFPHFSTEFNHPSKKKLFLKVLKWFFLLGITLCVVYILIIKSVGTPYLPAVAYNGILSLIILVVTIGHLVTQSLVALNREKSLALIAGASLCLNIFLNFIWLKNGVYFAALSTLITEIAVTIFSLIICIKDISK